MSSFWGRIGSQLARAAVRAGRSEVRRRLRDRADGGAPSRRRGRGGTRKTTPAPATHAGGDRPVYPGDFVGTARIEYAPHPDGQPDPGEVVWSWVPYEEDHRRGKDRPALVIGRDGRWLLALPLTSKDHDIDAEQERRAGREWVDIGTGSWDRQGRPSEVRVDRVLRLDPDAVRREGGRLSRDQFEAVAVEVRRLHGWPA